MPALNDKLDFCPCCKRRHDRELLFLLVDVARRGLSGKSASDLLEGAGIIVNKNTIPLDPQSPFVTSGLRLGTPAVSTRGMTPDTMKKIAGLILRVLDTPTDESVITSVRSQVRKLCKQFPLYS